MLSHQAAKRLANESARREDSSYVAGGASRIPGAWLVSQVEPERPEDLIAGSVWLVLDDGRVETVGTDPDSMARLEAGEF